ncbi:MAG: toll/interleukin-1 receptor domain-containing protein, partial [Rhizobacter sp.]|nr:toll/interleukin-1 receptor domain-containing protein [Rhizobacter sp.]
MTARVFISYRSSDGADKATALARDLDALFGQAQVFLDKDDLPAGCRWRDEIARALSEAPILLVLVTPNYLGAHDDAGRRCIDRADDPVRDELETA